MFHLDGKIEINYGSSSQPGLKRSNDDAVVVHVPSDRRLATWKGIVAAIADGVSTADAGQEAAQLCIRRVVDDYYASPDVWSTRHAGENVLTTLNRRLYGLGKDLRQAEKGFVCTLSVLILKSRTAHIFHIGDTRIYRLRDRKLELLTTDHKVRVGEKQTYLSRAIGLDNSASVDYSTTDLQEDDIFLLSSDGFHDYVDDRRTITLLSANRDHLQNGCDMLTREALDMGSPDNVSCVAVRIRKLPENSQEEIDHRLTELPFAPLLSKGDKLNGYCVEREICASARSQIYLVRDQETDQCYAMKTPSPNYDDDRSYIERFIMESWIGARIDHPNVVKVVGSSRPRRYLYYLTEYVDGIPLTEWVERNPAPQLQMVREIIEQIVAGVRALHRKEILHQDLKPDNILIDKSGGIKIVDFGSCRVAGFEEICGPIERDLILGTVDYAAPEYQLHTPTGNFSDLFSVGCIAYLLLTGHHPYGSRFAKCKTPADYSKLSYRPSYHYNPDIPLWVDGALETAVKIDPADRYEVSSKFVEDLRTPNREFLLKQPAPLHDRNPLLFWKICSAVLGLIVIALLIKLFS